MDDSGSGRTSDVIAATEWIFQNHEANDIKVVNYSLHGGGTARFYDDPLNKAVSKLWHAGIVVVAAAGNYGKDGAPSGVLFAPGNNPFVITVGAIDIGGTARTTDDDRAPWSAYGRTQDGFWKPEICAPGRMMVGPIPMSSTLAVQKASKIRSPGYVELSGTSFAAPVITGIAAQILARNPDMTPDQVKGAIMRRARAVPRAEHNSCGVGQVNAVRAVLNATKASNPNAALNRFLTTDATTGQTVFDAVSWTDVSWSDVSWDAVSWTDVSWSDVSWDAVSWSDVSWTDVSWSDVSWSDVSWEDAARGAGHAGWIGCAADSGRGSGRGRGSGARSASRRPAAPQAEHAFRSNSSTGAGLAPAPVLTLSGELAVGYPARGMPHPEGRNRFGFGHGVTQLRGRFAAAQGDSGMKGTSGR